MPLLFAEPSEHYLGRKSAPNANEGRSHLPGVRNPVVEPRKGLMALAERIGCFLMRLNGPRGLRDVGHMGNVGLSTMREAPVYVVVPAYNEELVIRNVIRGLKARCAHVVVVDDGSRDKTSAEATKAGAIVLTHLINRGQGAALKTGIDYALGCGAEVIVTFDSDGQHQAEDMDRLVAPILRGETDVTLGSRFLEPQSQIPALRKFTLKLGVLFTRLISRVRVTDTHNGLRALSRAAALRIQIRQDRMAHASEILDEIGRLQLRYREVPTKILYSDYTRQKGQRSSAAFRIAYDFLLGKWE